MFKVVNDFDDIINDDNNNNNNDTFSNVQIEPTSLVSGTSAFNIALSTSNWKYTKSKLKVLSKLLMR